MSENNKKKTKHSLIALLLFVLLTVTLSIGGTLAYFTHMDADTNKLQVGYNEIAIKENFEPPAELTSGDNAFKKQVQITNTGNVDCYVRVFMEFSEGNIDNFSKLSADGTNYYSSEEYKTTNTPDGWVYVSREEDPVLGDYYYYKEPLAPGESTTYLLDSVKTTFPTAEDVDDFEIIVYSESVQTLDKNGKPFENPDAWKKCWDEFIDYVYEEPVIYHTVTFIADGGTFTPDGGSTPVETHSIQVLHGETVSRPSDEPKKNDGIFLDWYNESGTAAYDFSSPIITDTVIRAKWEDLYHTVTFKVGNEGGYFSDYTTEYTVLVKHGDSVERPAKDPSSMTVGDSFEYWKLETEEEDEAYVFSTPVTSDITIIGVWGSQGMLPPDE